MANTCLCAWKLCHKDTKKGDSDKDLEQVCDLRRSSIKYHLDNGLRLTQTWALKKEKTVVYHCLILSSKSFQFSSISSYSLGDKTLKETQS